MKKTTMAVKTRSKLGGQKEQKTDTGINTETSTEQKEVLSINELERTLGTKSYGVKIKKEKLDEILEKKSTDLQLERRGREEKALEGATEASDFLGRSKLHVEQGRSGIFTDGLVDRKTDKYSSTSTGKRRLFANKTQQRNKKFFPDIRRYAQATLTKEFVGSFSEDTGNSGNEEPKVSETSNTQSHGGKEEHIVNDDVTGHNQKYDRQHRYRNHGSFNEEEGIDFEKEPEVIPHSMGTNEDGMQVTNKNTTVAFKTKDKRQADILELSEDSDGSVTITDFRNRNRNSDTSCHEDEIIDLAMELDTLPNSTKPTKDGRHAIKRTKQALSYNKVDKRLTASLGVMDHSTANTRDKNKDGTQVNKNNQVSHKNKDNGQEDKYTSADDSDASVTNTVLKNENSNIEKSFDEEEAIDLEMEFEILPNSTHLNKDGKKVINRTTQADEKNKVDECPADRSEVSAHCVASLIEKNKEFTQDTKQTTHSSRLTKVDKRLPDRLELPEDGEVSSYDGTHFAQSDDADSIDYEAMLSSYDIPDNTPLQERVEDYVERTGQISLQKGAVPMEWDTVELRTRLEQKQSSQIIGDFSTYSAETNNSEQTISKSRQKGDELAAKNLRVLPVRDTGGIGSGSLNCNYERRLGPRTGLAKTKYGISMNGKVHFHPATQTFDKSDLQKSSHTEPEHTRGGSNTTKVIRGKVKNIAHNRTVPKQFTIIAKSISTVDQTIRERGLDMVDDKTLWVTPVKIEFNIDRQIVQYNVREQVTNLLKKMQVVDSSLKIKSATDEKAEWTNVTDLPEDVEFSTHFKVQDFSFRKMRKVVVYMTLVTRIHINRIKYGEKVKEHLFTNNIWFKPDRFETKVESSPGVITMIHPKLINRDEYKNELQHLLKVALQDFNTKDNAAETEIEVHDTDNAKVHRKEIPTFFLETSVKKWRDLSVEVVRINCAKEDSEFLKLLLSYLSEQNGFRRGVFVPEGLHLIEGKELVYNILQAHESFLQSITSIPLSGILYKDLAVVLPSTKKTLRDTILSVDGVESLEKSRDRFQTGNFSVLVIRKKLQLVMECLEQNIADFYKSQSGQTRMVMIGHTRMKTSKDTNNSVMSYAEVLSTKFQPTHTTQEQTPTRSITSSMNKKNNSPGQRGIKPIAKKLGQDQVAETPSLRSTQKPDENMHSHILSKLKEMELKQTALQEKHEQLKKEHKQHHNEQQRETNQTRNRLTEHKIEEIINEKMGAMNAAQDIRLQEMETKIKKEVGKTIDKKADSISVIVGNHVAAQLMGLFQQYLTPRETTDTHVIRAKPATPMITQEGQVTPIKAGKLLIDTSKNNDLDTRVTDTTKMLEAIKEIDVTTNRTCSPHDNFTEQPEDPC